MVLVKKCAFGSTVCFGVVGVDFTLQGTFVVVIAEPNWMY